MTDNIKIIHESEGQSLSVVGDTYRIVVSGKQSNGAFAVIDMLVPPGGGPGPHSHASINESFYVVEGEINFTTETGRYTAKKGVFVNIPTGGEVHGFKNDTNQTAHLLCTVIPSGLEEFFEEIGKPVEAGTFLPPPVLTEEAQKNLQAVAEKYGQKIYPPDYLD